MNWHRSILVVMATVTAVPATAHAQVATGRPISVNSLRPQQQAMLGLEMRDNRATLPGTLDGLQQQFLQQQALQQQAMLAELAKALQKQRDDYLRRLAEQQALLARAKQFGFVVAPKDLDLLQTNPQLFGLVYQAYAPRLHAYLGDAFRGLTEEGYAAAFACLVMYQMKPYRAMGDPSPAPADFSLGTLLATPKLVCDEYCYAAALLFAAIPPAYRPKATFAIVGWDKGTFGNHAQLFVTGVGIPLLLDPTNGVVARADLTDVRAGKPVSPDQIWHSSYRHDYSRLLAAAMNVAATRVMTALRDGLYPKSVLLYNWTLVTGGQ